MMNKRWEPIPVSSEMGSDVGRVGLEPTTNGL